MFVCILIWSFTTLVTRSASNVLLDNQFFYTFMYLQMNHGTLYFSKSKIQKFFEWMQMEDNIVNRSICWRVFGREKSLQCKHTININLLFPLQLSCFLLSHLYFIDTHTTHLFFVILWIQFYWVMFKRI